eukprot:7432201-Karenia_brevis.AAC.1
MRRRHQRLIHMRPHPRGSSGLEVPSAPGGGLGGGSRGASAAPKHMRHSSPTTGDTWQKGAMCVLDFS